MGNKPVEKKKKKGRPSLLDLQKRSLRLQKQQQQQQQKIRNPNPNPIPNPYLRFPNLTSSRRTTRRNPNFEAEDVDDDDDEEDSSGKRREKKLKLVLRIPNGSVNSPPGGSDSESSGSESDGDGESSRKKRKIDAVEVQTGGRRTSELKATDPLQGEPSDSGPTTPLPDKKLLVFILDRLQKKDTYGVFSEPVDPSELPDYHDIIKHPMDFGTVRKKLSSGTYVNLEQFERDVFLISSNAMRYNALDTVYYRQGRSIQELAKKDFENLRQESDDNEPESKIVRRGRPPSKNTIKQMVGRPPANRSGSDFSSDATLANARDSTHWSNSTSDLLRRGLSFDKPSMVDACTRASHSVHYSETCRRNVEHRSDRNEEYSGSPLKGIPTRNWKKISVIDSNRRNTYKQPLLSTCAREPSILTAFDREKKLLLPVGLHMEHSYSRSLTRFAASLGPAGWEIAAKWIERVLPSGTKFGPGWVGDSEAPRRSQLPLLSTSPHPSSQPKISRCTTLSSGNKLSESHELASDNSSLPPSASASAAPTPSRSSEAVDCAEGGRFVDHEGEFNQLNGGMRPKTPSQLHQNLAMQPSMNGFNPGFGFNLPSQAGKMVTLTRSPEAAMTHGRALDMVSRSSNNSFVNHQAPFKQLDAEEKSRLAVGNPSTINSGSMLPDSVCNSEGQWRGLSLNPKPGSVPPDLNVDFQSPGSPVSGVLADSQQQPPDLALQL